MVRAGLKKYERTFREFQSVTSKTKINLVVRAIPTPFEEDFENYLSLRDCLQNSVWERRRRKLILYFIYLYLYVFCLPFSVCCLRFLYDIFDPVVYKCPPSCNACGGVTNLNYLNYYPREVVVVVVDDFLFKDGVIVFWRKQYPGKRIIVFGDINDGNTMIISYTFSV